MRINQMPNFITNMPKFEKIFWATILLLFSITTTLHFLGSAPQPKPAPQPKTPIITPAQNIKDGSDIINNSLNIELEAINDKITEVAHDLFNTDNVDKFLDFHYSVSGEYLELLRGVTGRIEKIISEKLFGKDFKERQTDLINQINEQFKLSADNHAESISDIALKDIDEELNSAALARLKNDIEYNANLQIGKTRFLTTTIVSTIIGKTSIKIAKSAAIKLTVKTAGKIAAKGGLAAAVASVGIFCGPAVLICAPALAIIAWFGTDYIIVKLDEYWHREEFKQEIISLINESKDSFIKQYNEVYEKHLNHFSEETKTILINSDLKVKNRITGE